MFKNRGLFGGMWKPKNPHSLDHLKYLYSVLYKNQTVTETNRSLLVETLRSIAEILIWGDQNDSTVFDFFLERNMLSFFLKIMNQKCGSYVCVQLLQTLNILFENIRNETSIYYLLSNNHVNSIIVHKFDFSDEEVMAYYISFLKTLSFRLNKHTIHFFYNEHTNDFPLYTEAIKFFNHSETMVRIAVRTLTLNVYRVEEESMLRFVIDKTAVPYFANLVWFIGNHILEIDVCVRNDADHRSLGRLKDLVAEHLDHLHYLNDILCLRIDNLNEVLTGHLLNRLFIPLYIYSLVRQPGTSNTLEDMKPHVSKVTALFLLCQVFLIITHVPLVRLLAWIIFAGDATVFTERGAAKIAEYTSTNRKNVSESSTSKELSASGKRANPVKPSFVAPSQTLEKSLREHIQTVDSADFDSFGKGSSSKKDDEASKKKVQKKRKQSSKEVSPIEPTRRTSQGAAESEYVASFSTLSKLTGLSPGQEPAEGATSRVVDVKADEKSRVAGGAAEKEEEEATVGPITPKEEFTLEGRPFLAAVFAVHDCSENDYLVLYAQCLIHAIQNNEGMSAALLESVRIPCSKSETKEWYNTILMEKLLQVLLSACQYGSRIRLVTLDIGIDLIKSMVLKDGRSYLADSHFAELEGIKEESTLLLRNFYKSEEIFLDMFEDEYRASCRPNARVELLMSDASLLLPPTGTPLTGIDFTKRLPCGEVERARRSIRTFFRLRQLSLDIQGRLETRLPLSSPDTCIQVQDVLDLNNSDLLAVTVTPTTSSQETPQKQRRFLVVDVYQVVLVEPDSTRLGWGVATFVGFLQDLEVVTDKEDSRCLHVTVHSPGGSYASTSNTMSTKNMPLLSATFTFDDHIRCMAAKQRLTKGRVKARQRKMHQIARLLELPGNVAPSCPSPPSVNLHSLRKEAVAQRRSRTGSSGSSSPRHYVTSDRHSGASSSRTGAYRPLFNTSSKVPGAAALLRERGGPASTNLRPAKTAPSHLSSLYNAASSSEESEVPTDHRSMNRDGSGRTRQRRTAAAQLSNQEADRRESSPLRALARLTCAATASMSTIASNNSNTSGYSTAVSEIPEEVIAMSHYTPVANEESDDGHDSSQAQQQFVDQKTTHCEQKDDEV